MVGKQSHCFQVSDPLLHLSCALYSCSERPRWVWKSESRERRGGSRSGWKSASGAHTSPEPLLPLNSSGGGVPGLVLHPICWGNVNGEGVFGVWSAWSCGSAVFSVVFCPHRGSAASFRSVMQSNGPAPCCLWHRLHWISSGSSPQPITKHLKYAG